MTYVFDTLQLSTQHGRVDLWFMVFNDSLSNISAISWRSLLLMEETEVFREKHRSRPRQ
jgi:hypothetical protein